MNSYTNLPTSITYLGVNDHEVDLFEGQFIVPDGISYNSYLIQDEKIAILDSVDMHYTDAWLSNIATSLDGKSPDFLVIHHMEPDHSGCIKAFMDTYENATIVCNAKSVPMLKNFFDITYEDRSLIVKNGDELTLDDHRLTFIQTPMVHWPEVMMSYDQTTKTLFSADAFGRFGALDVKQDWTCEARRYYFGIVAPYGKQVQAAFKKLSGYEISSICPLHGPVLTDDLSKYLDLYNTWSSYEPESQGVCIVCASVYGHTLDAARKLACILEEKGITVSVHDLVHQDEAEAIEDAFRFNTLVCASVTYNGSMFPAMRNFLHNLVEKKFQKRSIGFIQNGSWAPMATKAMKTVLEECKDLSFIEKEVTLIGSLNASFQDELEAFANELANYVNDK